MNAEMMRAGLMWWGVGDVGREVTQVESGGNSIDLTEGLPCECAKAVVGQKILDQDHGDA